MPSYAELTAKLATLPLGSPEYIEVKNLILEKDFTADLQSEAQIDLDESDDCE